MSQPEKHPSSSSKLSFEEPSPGIFTPDPVSSSSELHFDPGPLAPRRRSTSCCKLFLGVIVVLIAIFVGKVLYIIGTTLYTQTTFPFRPLYQNQTMNEVKNRSMVVQPLVGDDQTFDIAVTVWTLKEEPEAENNETVLFSDIVFRDLRLKDKYKSVDVAFQVPTAMFHRPTINSTDLRASFVLIPSSPSPLDYLKSYSSWYPSGMQRPPIRSYSTERSLVDETLDSFGISIPLLTGGEIPSRCGSAEEEEEEEEGDDAPKSQHLLRDLCCSFCPKIQPI
ncbi:hypothetical protein C8J56DRAFT_1037490 [Mycena floridula]|nr:hypothetical protein C8J56DRAFT_1037490 [Mycena floridula]